MTGVQLPAGVMIRFFSPSNSFQTSSGAHPASYPVGAGSCYSGGKADEAWRWALTST